MVPNLCHEYNRGKRRTYNVRSVRGESRGRRCFSNRVHYATTRSLAFVTRRKKTTDDLIHTNRDHRRHYGYANLNTGVKCLIIIIMLLTPVRYCRSSNNSFQRVLYTKRPPPFCQPRADGRRSADTAYGTKTCFSVERKPATGSYAYCVPIVTMLFSYHRAC